MESSILLSLVAALVVSPVTPVSVRCINGNCTESSDLTPVFNLGSIFPFFGPVDFNAERDREPKDNVISPLEPATNESDPQGGIVSIHVVRIFSFPDPSQQDQDQPKGELGLPMGDFGSPMGDFGSPVGDFGPPMGDFGPPPFLQKIFNSVLEEIGLLDLSGKNLTSAEVYSALAARKAEGHPVTTLILSNSRIHPMDAGTFAAAEDTLTTLIMPNTSANLDALRGLTNLKVLNLSNNGLSTFPWFGLMSDTLEVLDLSNNKYEEIRPELSMLKNLRQLFLSNNKIMYVDEAPLNMLPNLDTLDLSMNVLTRANFEGLKNLKQLNVDWNYLRLMGTDCRLPSQPLTLKLASNPWRCDCGLLQSRDNNEILDLDLLQCAEHSNFANYCNNCERSFLPDTGGLQVAALTKDLVGHRGCKDMPELYNYISDKYVKFTDDESGRLVQDILLFMTMFIFLLVCVFVSVKICSRSKYGSEGKVWIKAQQIPKWSFDKIGKQQEVPYIEIEKTPTNV